MHQVTATEATPTSHLYSSGIQSLLLVAKNFKERWNLPDFQRNYVWDKERQEACLKAMVTGQPLGLIYVGGAASELIDGQQRSTTIAWQILGHAKSEEEQTFSSTLLTPVLCFELGDDGFTIVNETPVTLCIKTPAPTVEIHNRVDVATKLTDGTPVAKKTHPGLTAVLKAHQSALRKGAGLLDPAKRYTVLIGPLGCIEPKLREGKSKVSSHIAVLQGVLDGYHDLLKETTDADATNNAIARKEAELRTTQMQLCPATNSFLRLWDTCINNCAHTSTDGTVLTGERAGIFVTRLPGTWDYDNLLEFFGQINSKGQELTDRDKADIQARVKFPKTRRALATSVLPIHPTNSRVVRDSKNLARLDLLGLILRGTPHTMLVKQALSKVSDGHARLADEAWERVFTEQKDFFDADFNRLINTKVREATFKTAGRKLAVAFALRTLALLAGTTGATWSESARCAVIDAVFLAKLIRGAGTNREQELNIIPPTGLSHVEALTPDTWGFYAKTLVDYITVGDIEAARDKMRSGYFTKDVGTTMGEAAIFSILLRYTTNKVEHAYLGAPTENTLDLHHIFPKAYLEGVPGVAEPNCLANLIPCEPGLNNDVRSKSPAEYWQQIMHSVWSERTEDAKRTRLQGLILPQEWTDAVGFESWWAAQFGTPWSDITTDGQFNSPKDAYSLFQSWRANKMEERASELLTIGQEQLEVLGTLLGATSPTPATHMVTLTPAISTPADEELI